MRADRPALLKKQRRPDEEPPRAQAPKRLGGSVRGRAVM